ncbi:MAG: hypothetical protein ACYDBQ_09675 [Thermoplasmatota archaeon]
MSAGRALCIPRRDPRRFPGAWFAQMLPVALLAMVLAGCASHTNYATPSTARPVTPTMPTTEPQPAGSSTSGTHEAATSSLPPVQMGPFMTLVTTVNTTTAGATIPFGAFDTTGFGVADLLGSGHLDIVTNNDNLQTYVIDAASGHVAAEIATYHPNGWLARDINGVAIGDITGNGTIDLAILNSAATLTVEELNRTQSTPSHLAFHPLWQRVATATAYDPHFNATHPWYGNRSVQLGADGNPFIAHVGGVPGGVVLAQSDGWPGDFAFNANGTLRWMTDYWDGDAGPWAGWLDPGGPVQAVFATAGGHVVDNDVASGAIQWDFNATGWGATPGSITPTPVAYDLYGTGSKSIFVGARVAVAPVNSSLASPGIDNAMPTNGTSNEAAPWMRTQHAAYFLLDAGGHVLWNASLATGNPLVYMVAAAVDVNHDGVKDLIVLDWNTIGHFPGNWEKTGPANLFALDGRNGHLLSRASVDSRWSNKGIAVADFLATGQDPQILVEEQLNGVDGLSLYALNGTHLAWMPLPGNQGEVTRGPELADIDGSGFASAIVPIATSCPGGPGSTPECASLPPSCSAIDVGCRAGSLLVFRTRAPDASVAWSNNLLYDSADTGALAVARPS